MLKSAHCSTFLVKLSCCAGANRQVRDGLPGRLGIRIDVMNVYVRIIILPIWKAFREKVSLLLFSCKSQSSCCVNLWKDIDNFCISWQLF